MDEPGRLKPTEGGKAKRVSEGGNLKISAVVCTYNNASLLRHTLDSLTKQTLPPQEYEIIVVDNNSTDNTKEVVLEFQEQCSHQIHYVLETTQGLSAARNTGIQQSNGPIISFIDDDAEAAPEWLAAVMEAFRQHPDAWGVGGNTFAIWDAERPAWLTDDFLGNLSIQDRGPKERELTINEHILGTNCSFRREVFAEIGDFPTDLGRVGKSLLAGEEAELCRRIRLQGKSMYHIPNIVVYHHVTPERMTRSYFRKRCYLSGLSRAFYVSRTDGASFARRELRGRWLMLTAVFFRDVIRCLTLKRPQHTLFRYWTWFLTELGYTRGLRQVRRTFLGIGCIAILVIVGLSVAGAFIEPARWYLVGIASALLLLGGGLLALSYARFILNRIISDQRTQVSDINKQIVDINKQVSNLNKQVSNTNKQVSDIKQKVSDIKKEVAPYDGADLRRIERIVSIEKQVEMAELQNDLRDSKPILFFNATSGPGRLSFASTAGLIISWALRLSGHRVIHLVCRNGLRRCIQGTNRHEINQPMPCEKCYAIRSKMFPQDLRRYLEPKSEAPSALFPLGSYSLDELANFVYQGIKIGELCISSVRWTLRRHRLDSDPRATRLLREYIRGGMGIVDTLQKLLQEQELHSMVVFNGVFYPEAIAREVALQKGLPVVAYEISLPALKVFLSHGIAAGGSLITIPEDFQMSAAQEADLDEYVSQRIRGGTAGQARLWPEMKSIEPGLQAFADQYKNVVSVFTNVIFDTSQYGTNTVFESMFDWLDEIMKLASLHPETLFVVRAHPAEVLPGHESEELVGDWLKEQSYTTIPNVRFIPPTDHISSYELLKLSHFCLVYNSTIGLEAVVLGIPTVTAAAGRYIGAGVTHAPASRKAYRKLVETFLKNDRPPVADAMRQRARYFMYQLFFRQGIDLSTFLEAPDWTLKPIDASALHPDNSPESNIIYKGIMDGGPFYYPP